MRSFHTTAAFFVRPRPWILRRLPLNPAEATDKSPVTPGAILPAREMLGDLLLELNQPQKALDSYERSLKDSPNRLNGLSGAARAAQSAGDVAKARGYYAQLARLLGPAAR